MNQTKGGLNSPTLATRRSLLLHPLIVATCLWGILLLFYALHLSDLLRFSISELVPLILAIWTPFTLVALGFALWRPKPLLRRYKVLPPTASQLVVIERRLKTLWRLWLAAAIFETIISGGFPIVWLFTNPAKSYFDYGVPSLHGLVNSILLALTLCRVGLYLLTGKRRHLKLPLFSIIWWLVLVTRGTILFTLVSCAILLLLIRPVRTKTLLRMAGYGIVAILLFGWAGDQRTGADRFRELAQPTASYPQWLPSGILWVYIYATTPLNNLVYTRESSNPAENLLLPHTMSQLFPTVIRRQVYGDEDDLQGDLIDSQFNVSTAYLGPIQDYGLFAVFLFSLVAASACQWFWYKPDLRSQLIFSVLAQCLVFSVFYDLFLSLPMISQIVWFTLITRKKRTVTRESPISQRSLSAVANPVH